MGNMASGGISGTSFGVDSWVGVGVRLLGGIPSVFLISRERGGVPEEDASPRRLS